MHTHGNRRQDAALQGRKCFLLVLRPLPYLQWEESPSSKPHCDWTPSGLHRRTSWKPTLPMMSHQLTAATACVRRDRPFVEFSQRAESNARDACGSPVVHLYFIIFEHILSSTPVILPVAGPNRRHRFPGGLKNVPIPTSTDGFMMKELPSKECLQDGKRDCREEEKNTNKKTM